MRTTTALMICVGAFQILLLHDGLGKNLLPLLWDVAGSQYLLFQLWFKLGQEEVDPNILIEGG